MMPEAEKFLNSLINYERTKTLNYNFKLGKFRRFLRTLGNPERKLSNVILIAGTKGKGSTAAFIESGLRTSGLKTGLFTSPHILSIRERIKVNNIEISQRDLDRLAKKIIAPAKKYKITFFEAITAIAFLYFLEKKIDYTVLEVGLGGRLDSTNVVEPKVSVITKIGYDHTNLLGKTLTKISQEKAGIIHHSSFVVIAKQRPVALKTIKARIKLTKSNCLEVVKTIKVKNIHSDLSNTEFIVHNLGKYKINMIGRHQIDNACTAIVVLSYLQKQDDRITNKGMRLGLERANILARCQIVSKKPLIIVDGAHNPESVQALYNVIRDNVKKKAIIVFGSSQGKLVKKMFQILAPITKELILTQSKNPRSISSSELAKILKPFRIHFLMTQSVDEAISKAISQIPIANSPLVITGSFYVASEVLPLLKKFKLY